MNIMICFFCYGALEAIIDENNEITTNEMIT